MKKILLLSSLIISLLIILVYIDEHDNEKLHRFKIGIATWGDPDTYTENVQGFKTAMNESGFVEEKNTEYIIEHAELNQTKQRQIISDFINKKVDLIYSLTTPGTLIAKNMTQNIPIVFSIVTYPVEAGIVNTLDHSGNNLVGTRNYIDVSTQLDLFSEIVPVKKIGFVHRHGEPNSSIQYNEMKEYGEKIGITVIEIDAKNIDDLSQKIQNPTYNVDAFYQACDTLIQNGGEDIVIKEAMKQKKPTFSCNLKGVKNGALFGDVSDFSLIGYMAGHKASLVLSGAKPNDIFTESQPHGNIVINLKTANYLRIQIPDSIMSIASEVIR